MKKTITLIFTSILFIQLAAQQEFSVEIEALEINNAPSTHSFSWGKTTDGKWLIVGGRIDGLHQRQPFAAFLASENNKKAFLIDPKTQQTWEKDLSGLPTSVFEQIQSTNQQFYQRGSFLYITGGYGYSAFLNEHVTYPNLIALNVDGLASAIISNASINNHFRQITDTRLAVTGGQLGYLDSIFYLCGGQFFEGRYNPMGPDHGPGFIQNYTNEIRKFKITDDGTNLNITNYTTHNDPTNLHRRDYNMAPQIFPNGEKGFTMFSGVFNANDLPFLNPVDVYSGSYVANNNFNQYLSHYHSAKTPLFDEASNTMHTLFFGGMSQFTLDANDNLIEDTEVPFVKTISLVTRFTDGAMEEKKLDIEMPALLGAGAEFIPVAGDSIFIDHEIVDLNKINDKTHIGYIYGGIESTAANIFFSNTGIQSSASAQIFKVFINPEKSQGTVIDKNVLNPFAVKLYPNPTEKLLYVEFDMQKSSKISLNIYNVEGKMIMTQNYKQQNIQANLKVDVGSLENGEYILVLEGGKLKSEHKFQIIR